MLSGSFGISEGAHNSQNTRKQHIKKIVSFATKTNQMWHLQQFWYLVTNCYQGEVE